MEWFLNTDEKVEGPYTVEAIRTLIDAGQLAATCLVWGRGQADWLPTDKWLQALNNIVQIEPSKTSSQAWHYAVNGDSKGPFSRAELIHELRNIREKDQILVWTKGMKAWADLYEFPDLTDELSLDRREDTRVDIAGTLTIRNEAGRTVMGPLKTISVGGCGGTGMGNILQIGNQVTVEIKSDSLANPIATKAQVQYVTEAGFVGIKFDGLNMESKSLIQLYIRDQKSAKMPVAA